MTLHELHTAYSVEQLYDLIEVGLVNAHNTRIMKKRLERK